MYEPTKLSSCQLLVRWGCQSEPTDGFPVEKDYDDVIEQDGNDGDYD